MSKIQKARKTAYNKWISSKKSPFASVPDHISPVDFDEAMIQTSSDPVIDALLARKDNPDSFPGKRSDRLKIALGIEGGGMTGVISSGMCALLEDAGLIRCFDSIYGCSAGSITAAYAAGGQARLGSTNFQDLANFNLINPFHILFGEPIVDLDFLFNQLMLKKKPISFEKLLAGPELNISAVSAETGKLKIFNSFKNIEDVIGAARASSSLPLLAGPAKEYRGELMTDGGLLEPIPYPTAIRDGATHILVLRPRRENYRKKPYNLLTRLYIRKNLYPELVSYLDNRHSIYNTAAQQLDYLCRGSHDERSPKVKQITIPNDYEQVVQKLTTKPEAIDAGFKLGMKSMAKEILKDSIDVFWTPTVYSA